MANKLLFGRRKKTKDSEGKTNKFIVANLIRKGIPLKPNQYQCYLTYRRDILNMVKSRG